MDNLLAGKVSTGSLAISDVANLQSSLEARQSLLSDRDGTGVTLRDGNSVLRRIVGAGGVQVVVPINIGDPTDPENFQLKVDGSALQTAIAAKQDALTSSTALSCGALKVGGAVQVTGGPTGFPSSVGQR